MPFTYFLYFWNGKEHNIFEYNNSTTTTTKKYGRNDLLFLYVCVDNW